MNKDEFADRWQQIREQARQWWDKLTDADLQRADGNFELFISIVQEKYGYTRETVEADLDKGLAELEAKPQPEPAALAAKPQPELAALAAKQQLELAALAAKQQLELAALEAKPQLEPVA